MDDAAINAHIVFLREGELSNKKYWLADARKAIQDKFGIKLSRTAIKKRYYRNRKAKQPHVSFSNGGNEAVAYSDTSDIRTLDQLLSACEVDLDVWLVNNYTVNKWSAMGKDGNTVPMFQVKAHLKRKVPIKSSWPTVNPTCFNLGEIEQPTSATSENRLLSAIVFGDAHVGFSRNYRTGGLEPFHSRRAISIVFQVVADVKPDRIVMLGDTMDLAEWSTNYRKRPEFYFTTQPALVELSWIIARLRKLSPLSRIDYIAGNHTARIDKAVVDNLLAAHGLCPADMDDGPPVLSVDNLLGLSRMGVTVHDDYPNDYVWLNENLACCHGDVARSSSGATSQAILRDARHSQIIGHIHRVESASKTVYAHDGSRTYKVLSPGCLCRIDGVVPAQKSRQNWSQGFAHILYEPGDGIFTDTLVNVYGGRCLFKGKVYAGRDYTGELVRDTGWKF